MIRFVLIASLLGMFAAPVHAEDRAAKVRGDRRRVEQEGYWIYNSLSEGVRQAEQSGKPLLVVLRCIPCKACAQIDKRVVEGAPIVRALLDKFVRVRIVHANGLDLSLFQYDYDQSWAAFFLNADLTIYGRYGTRSHRTESHNDVSLEGFAAALEGALALHARYPKNKAALAGKRREPPAFKRPELYPSLRGEYEPTLDYPGQVVKSCIHCHQVGEAQRLVYREAGKPIPTKLLYPYPNPKILGLVMDPEAKARVKAVRPNSSAAEDGFRAGDEIATLAGQPMLSIADMQWLLHNAGETGALKAEVARDGKTIPLTLTLDEGWRERGDIAWRATSWDLRRMVTGGLVLEELPDAARREAKLPEDRLALRVKHVGQYGNHAVAKRAGFHKGDILTAVDGQSQAMNESELMALLVNQTRPGDRVAIQLLRDGKPMELTLRMQ